MSIIGDSEAVPDVGEFGITAFTTTRTVGTFGVLSSDPVNEVMGRWARLRHELQEFAPRFATSGQVHGNHILTHDGTWRGWLRGEDADGHFVPARGTAVAITVADCVPVFVAHPRGAVQALHAGWRGTAARILEHGLCAMKKAGFDVAEARVHMGPSICGRCYEVGPDVYAQLTGRDPGTPAAIDLRALLADQARAAGASHISISSACTRCNNDRFYSHRAGDPGRQLGVIVAS